jgi:hypothetical protein
MTYGQQKVLVPLAYRLANRRILAGGLCRLRRRRRRRGGRDPRRRDAGGGDNLAPPATNLLPGGSEFFDPHRSNRQDIAIERMLFGLYQLVLNDAGEVEAVPAMAED